MQLSQEVQRSVKLPTVLLLACIVACPVILSGCDQHHAPPTTSELGTLAPADPHLAILYEHSCKACHATVGSGAPLVHDKDAWSPRWSKGLATLRDHAIVGFQAMPAGGQCAVCTPKDYDDLIRFMAEREN